MSDIEYLEMINKNLIRLQDRIKFMNRNIFINELIEIKKDLNKKSNDLELYCRALINKLENE
jgi:hypothetical protein